MNIRNNMKEVVKKIYAPEGFPGAKNMTFFNIGLYIVLREFKSQATLACKANEKERYDHTNYSMKFFHTSLQMDSNITSGLNRNVDEVFRPHFTIKESIG